MCFDSADSKWGRHLKIAMETIKVDADGHHQDTDDGKYSHQHAFALFD
jgi:hypothetical protein